MPRVSRPLIAVLVLAFVAAVGWTTASQLDLVAMPQRDVFPGTGMWAQTALDDLTLEEKIAQLFAAAAYGDFKNTDAPSYEELVRLAEDFGIGGFVFFQGDPLSQATLINDLQERARLPLLISQDMEWGAGMRVQSSTTFPRAMAVGATRDTAYAYAIGRATAHEARALGVHQIYAPVADVNNNPLNPIINVRSFGEEPALVADMVTAFVHGAQDGGVIATVKHFPGHGDTATDSHADLPVIPHDRARLDALELVPFQAAVDAGVQSVMTAHVAFPNLEPDATVPGTLSPRVTQGLLREALGFEGLIVTDALNMNGVTKHFGPGEIAVRALEAGADVLLMSTDPYVAREAVVRAVRSGRLSEARIDASVLRVLKAKEWLGLNAERQVDLKTTREVVAAPPHLALSATVAREALTLLRNDDALLPLQTPGQVCAVVLSDSDDPDVGRTFVQTLRRFVAADQLETFLVDRRSRPAELDDVLGDVVDCDVVLAPAFAKVRAWSGTIGLPEAQQAFLGRLVQAGPPVALIALGNPYLALGLDAAPAAYVIAYGSDDELQTAAAQALFGAAGFHGQLPVTIPETYAYGAGLRVPQTQLRRGYPEEAGLSHRALHRVDSLLHAAIADSAFPGAAVAIGRGSVLAKLDGYGYHTYESEQAVTPQSRFDLASLTKVIATTTAAMQLYEAGRLDLDAPVARYLPAFAQNGKEDVTVYHLLTHTSGLPAFRPFHRDGFTTREAVLDAIMAAELEFAPGTRAQYSDFGMITLMRVLEEITGQDFAAYAQEQIFEPLGMTRTGFLATDAPDTTAVPTELDTGFRGRLVRGEVHDETAWLLGGTAGHAGLFSTAEDLARFAYMLVNDGQVHGRAFLQPETIRRFTTRVDTTHTRSLGWDTRSLEGYSSAGALFGPRSFGHTGFTGTSLWIDPDQDLFVILLTNRVYPTRANRKISAIRPALADLAYQSIEGEPGVLPLP